MKRNRNIGSILLIAAGLLLIAAALYELIPALLAYKRADLSLIHISEPTRH